MHSCLYLQVCTEGGGRGGRGAGAKTDCSTVLGLFTSGSEGAREGGIHVLTYKCAFFSFLFFYFAGVGGGHMHGLREQSVRPSTSQVATRKQNTAKKRLLLIRQHHVPPHETLCCL